MPYHLLGALIFVVPCVLIFLWIQRSQSLQKKSPIVNATVKSCDVITDESGEEGVLYRVTYEYRDPQGVVCEYRERAEQRMKPGKVCKRNLVKAKNGKYELWDPEVLEGSKGVGQIFLWFGGIVMAIILIAGLAQSEDPQLRKIGIVILLFLGTAVTGVMSWSSLTSIRNKKEDLATQTKAIKIKRRQKSIKQDWGMVFGFAAACIACITVAILMIIGIIPIV